MKSDNQSLANSIKVTLSFAMIAFSVSAFAGGVDLGQLKDDKGDDNYNFRFEKIAFIHCAQANWKNLQKPTLYERILCRIDTFSR